MDFHPTFPQEDIATMKTPVWKRTVSMALVLILLLCAAPLSTMAAEKTFTLIPLEGTDVELDQTAFQYTGQEIRPNVTVRVRGRLLTLDKDYTLEYADNIQVGTGKVIVTGIATASESVGYTGTVEIPFQITKDAPAFTLIQLKGTDVTIDGTEFAYTGSPIEPVITVTVEGKTLTAGKDYSLSYRNNVEVGTGTVTVSGIATASETVGYTGTVEIDFTIIPSVYQLKGTDVTIEGTKFTYTGSYIEPKVTVTVSGKELVRDEHYTLTYHNNIGVGTATASVNGIESAGYTGQVNVDFTIEKDTETPEPILIPLKGTDVTIDGTEFTYTGKAIEPKVTVKVEGKALVLGRDYSLTYENNVNVGTAYAVVQGIATASETVGYTGEVKIPFTIVKAQENTKPTEPEVTEPEATEPETTEPETTEPETTEPETTEPEVTEPETTIPEVTQPESDSSQSVSYKITRGDKATWYRQSTKTLSFTANGDIKAFEGVEIDGKDLADKYYSVENGTVVTLKKDFLQKLSVGKHTITILFEDGEAQGTFRVSEGLDATNPETGDRFNMGLWMTLMSVSAAGGIGLFVFRKKILG